MDWHALFRETRAQLGTLPKELRGFRWTAYSFQAKAWYGNRALHYEIWPRKYLKVVELGLHFEVDELRLPLRFCDHLRTLEPILREELPSDVRWVLPAPRAIAVSAQRRRQQEPRPR